MPMYVPEIQLKDRIKKLSAQEIAELRQDQAMRILEENANLIGDIEAVLFDEIEALGKARISVEQLKSLKNTIIEQNRALKAVINAG